MAEHADRRPADQARPGGSLRLARVGGVDILLHWTFVLLLALVVLQSWGSAAQLASWLVWLVAVFGSVLVHEYAHCVIARRRGAVVDDILLTPIGGMSQLRAMPSDPDDELAIAVVGPLTSFGLALVAAGAGALLGARIWPPTLFAGSWCARVLWLNVLLGGFNLLPALPMDGGRVLRSALARHGDRRTATLRAAQVARWLAFLMIAVGFVYNVWLILIGAFVLLGAGAEEQEALQPPRDEHGAPGPPDRRG